MNHIRLKGSSTASSEIGLLSTHLKQLSALTYPIKNANFSRAIASIRLSLSQTTLQKLLPLSKVVEILALLREFFLLGRGEFAIALISEADEKIRSRWRRQDTLAYEKQSGFGNVVIKEGEVSSVLARTWTAMFSLRGAQEDTEEDELLELARELVSLTLAKQHSTPHAKSTSDVAVIPFKTLLLSVPVSLTLAIPSPLDLFLTPQDVQIYTSINAYLLSIHRAHLRLTDLWKITSLRREHPAPPGPPHGSSSSGRAKVKVLRERSTARAEAMRSVWATGSAAVFLLAETQAYLQGEVVQGTWGGFKTWLTGEEQAATTMVDRATLSKNAAAKIAEQSTVEEDDEEEDIWLSAARATPPPPKRTHDPQTLSIAHRTYLNHLTTSLLLHETSFTSALYALLLAIDHLVALIHRIHAIWSSLDLEEDEGVVDAFSDFAKEEIDVRVQLKVVAGKVKEAIREVVRVLRELDSKEEVDDGVSEMEWDGEEGTGYKAKKVGRVDRLLMKLDFGGWFDDRGGEGSLEIDAEESDRDGE